MAGAIWLESVALADQPGQECHPAAGAVRVLVGIIGLVDEIWLAVLRPLGRGGEVGQGVVADEAAHQRESASPVLKPHRFPFIEHSLSSASNRAETRIELPKDAQHFDGGSSDVVAAHVVGAAGAIGGTAESEHDHADRAASRAEDSVVGGDDAIGVVEQILSILQAGLAERGVDVDGDPSAGTGSHELRCSLIAGPSRRDRIVTVDVDWFLPE